MSFLFVQYSGFGGINFNFLINMTFNLYVLWILGSIIQEEWETALFYASISSQASSRDGRPPLLSSGSLAGAAPSLLALLVVWTMVQPESENPPLFPYPHQDEVAGRRRARRHFPRLPLPAQFGLSRVYLRRGAIWLPLWLISLESRGPFPYYPSL